MSKKITVLGFGGTAHVAAAALTLEGHQVTLAFPEKYAKEKFADIEARGGILLRGGGLAGLARPRAVTTDLRAALADAEIILVSTVANYHEELAAAIAPYVRDDQVLVVSPGNAGALIFHQAFRRRGAGAPLVAETAGNLTSARLTGRAEALGARPISIRKLAAFPARDTAKAIAALDGVFTPEPLKHVFETTLNSPNVVNHLTASLLNASKLDDRGEEFRLFIDGLTPSVFKGLEAADREWQSVLAALGYWQMPSPLPHLREVTQPELYPQHAIFRGLHGPDGIGHRYVDEDAGAAVTLLVSLARLIGTPVPFTEAVLRIASALNDTDYYRNGRNLENLGLGGKTPDEIHHILQEGF
ncbi:MAG: NAD/NADP octopine/nopaline dehydrogenase family protein [Gracilibacteraceae bacterium]|nr:NAD/NADP octopine/nopaline dehydrogenase family protein [Gracilibacteraceae bacterium]